MKRLLVATRSAGKQRDFTTLLQPLEVEPIFPDDIGLAEAPEEAGIESHDSFEENARAKARWFAGRSGLPTLADDSGLIVDALHGLPGVRSKRFAGHSGPDEMVAQANNAALLAALAGVGTAQRTARYQSVLVLQVTMAGAWREAIGTGTTEGHIGTFPDGANGFGYDSIFVSDELGITFGAATDLQKRRVSHRARALDSLMASLDAELRNLIF